MNRIYLEKFQMMLHRESLQSVQKAQVRMQNGAEKRGREAEIDRMKLSKSQHRVLPVVRRYGREGGQL